MNFHVEEYHLINVVSPPQTLFNVIDEWMDMPSNISALDSAVNSRVMNNSGIQITGIENLNRPFTDFTQ